MNMQINPTSSHSHQLRDGLDDNDVIGYMGFCDIRNTSDFTQRFWDCVWFTAVLGC